MQSLLIQPGQIKMKTSLVIPATNGNFGYLDCVLAHYRDGVVKPDQVVISISNAHLVDLHSIQYLENKYSSVFENIKILKHNKIMVQGPNRSAASLACDNEIIISNDADDIPHPQRIQVIKYFFENHDIVHLNHSYQKYGDMFFSNIDIENIKYLNTSETFKMHYPNYSGESWSGRRPNPKDFGYDNKPYGELTGWEITCGCPAFHRNVFKVMDWRMQEEIAWDYDFNIDVLFHFRKSIIIQSKLMWYNLMPTTIRRERADAKLLGVLYKE